MVNGLLRRNMDLHTSCNRLTSVMCAVLLVFAPVAPSEPTELSLRQSLSIRIRFWRRCLLRRPTRASVKPGPFQEFYQRSLAKGIKPTMVRLALARKIAAITLTLWKKGEDFDIQKLNSQAA